MDKMTIGQVAKRAGVGVETVRFYERQALLDAPPRRASGYRQYSHDVIRRIQFIQRAKNLGFSLKEIRELLSLRVATETPCHEVQVRTEAKIADITAKLRDLQRMHTALVQLAAACTGQGPTSQCPILDALEAQETTLEPRRSITMRTTFDVKGMHCDGCEQRIRTALQKFPAITTMEIDHRRDLVAIEHQEADLEAVAMTMARLGFTVTQT